MKKPQTAARGKGVDSAEAAHFASLSETWWDVEGPFAPLHRLNPVRLRWLKDRLAMIFPPPQDGEGFRQGLEILDIGCGGGLIAAPLARLGAKVTGIDPVDDNIAAARSYAAAQGLEIDYQTASAEDLAAIGKKSGKKFDAVLAMEVVEHVPDPAAFIAAAAGMVKPDGALVLTTINRTLKAFLLAIIAGEYILRWLPRGTHHYAKLVKPEEAQTALADAGFAVLEETGIAFNPLSGRFYLTSDMEVNYMLFACRQPAGSPAPGSRR